MKRKLIPLVPSWEGLEIQAQNEAREASDTFASQPNRQAQNAFILDSHRAVVYGTGWFVVGWTQASWDSH